MTATNDEDAERTLREALAQADAELKEGPFPDDVSLEINPHVPFGDSGDGKIIGYMCRTEYDYELGYADGGSLIYNSIDDLKKCRSCLDECGIVEVQIELRRVVRPSNGGGPPVALSRLPIQQR